MWARSAISSAMSQPTQNTAKAINTISTMTTGISRADATARRI